MSRVEDLAAGVRRLKQDTTLQVVLTEIQSEAIDIFQNPSSTPEKILEAHEVIRLLGLLERKFDAIEADERIQNDRGEA
jgi:hypothetical protein